MKPIAAFLAVLAFFTAFAVPPECFALGGAASLEVDGLPLGSLIAWVGKYPGEDLQTGKQARPGKSFFEDPAMLPSLKAMLPKNILQIMLKGWKTGRVESPVEREGDVLKAGFCKPHDCPSVNAAVFVNMRTGKVQVCWFNSGEQRLSPSAWYSPGANPRKLAPGDDCFSGEGMGLLRKYGGK